jgi:hypothetical protein
VLKPRSCLATSTLLFSVCLPPSSLAPVVPLRATGSPADLLRQGELMTSMRSLLTTCSTQYTRPVHCSTLVTRRQFRTS